MALEVGSRLGHYDVTALIGEGGMGEVYQATDTTLDRDVALKVLPDAFTADPDRLARFEREAKVLASLNHPNIGAIYGLEKSGDTRALVLELIEGPTLADRIAKGPIPLDEALPIAKQIAEALEAAHEAGVIHRDLKPANIKVRDDGTVKVLDFGLAKAQNTTPQGDPSLSPTLTAAATQMGVIMGTAAYMAPEQAKGRTVDKRADVWAFGAVLFEMLTGRRAFPGEDLTDTIAAVMKSEPAWDALPADTAPRLTQILHACLEKDRARRVRDIGDVQLAMEGAFESLLRPTSAAESSGTAGWQRSLLYVVGGIALVAGVAIGAALLGGDDDVRPVQRFALSLPSTAKPWLDGLGGMAISSQPGQRVMRDATAVRRRWPDLDSADPAVFGQAGWHSRFPPVVLGQGRHGVRRRFDDQVRRSAKPFREVPDVVVGKDGRRRKVCLVSLGGATVDPSNDGGDLRIRKRPIVLKILDANRLVYVPGRHLTCCDTVLDRTSPGPRFSIGLQRHRRDVAGPVTGLAFLAEDRRHILRVGWGLVRLCVRHPR